MSPFEKDFHIGKSNRSILLIQCILLLCHEMFFLLSTIKFPDLENLANFFPAKFSYMMHPPIFFQPKISTLDIELWKNPRVKQPIRGEIPLPQKVFPAQLAT